MDERAERARRRFDGLLNDARAVIRETSQGQSRHRPSAASLLAAVRAMNRAGGFLEAIGIAFPDTGRELIVEFESFAREVEEAYMTPVAEWVIRARSERRAGGDRRMVEQRSVEDRRTLNLEVVAERRVGIDRREAADRRMAERRVSPERRFGSGAGWTTN